MKKVGLALMSSLLENSGNALRIVKHDALIMLMAARIRKHGVHLNGLKQITALRVVSVL